MQFLSRNHKIFPNTSPEISNGNRKTLISWIIEVHYKLDFSYETLYLTIYLIDKFCEKASMDKARYQLLALACLFIAGKYEDVKTPRSKKIISLCDGLFDLVDLLGMESQIMIQMNFMISQPTVNWYLSILLNLLQEN